MGWWKLRALVSVALALVMTGAAGTAVLASSKATKRQTGIGVLAPKAPIAPRGRASPPPDVSYIATLSAATSYSATPGGPPTGTLSATNPFGTPTVLSVIGAPDRSGWLHVELPIRPNGSTGWIAATAASLTVTSYKVVVSLAARTLTVTLAGKEVVRTAVTVGAPSTPTPPDQTYLWELIKPDDPSGPYGPYIFGLAEFSDAYQVFNGGNAQIGIHGQDEPWAIGEPASHGCIRLPNDVITQLAGMLPLGTPVSVS
jgi:lipoprotein-anchoring transpeptidase ErfK/SrfK